MRGIIEEEEESMGNPDSSSGPPPQTPAEPPQQPPQQSWQSQPAQPAPPPAGSGTPPSGGGMPGWTSNLTAQGTIAGPGGVPLADIPNRAIAAFIDFLIVGLVGWLVLTLFGSILVEVRPDPIFGIPIQQPSLLGQLIAALIAAGISAGYFIYLWSRRNGMTVGMQVLKLRLVDATSGGAISQDQAIKRWIFFGAPLAINFLYFLPLIGLLISLGVLVYYIYLLVTMAQSPTRQGLHDKQANTVVAKLA